MTKTVGSCAAYELAHHKSWSGETVNTFVAVVFFYRSKLSKMRTSRTTPSLCLFAWLLLVVTGPSTALVWSGTGVRWAAQCDFVGRDLKNQITTASQCGPLCQTTPSCSHFTWTNFQVESNSFTFQFKL